MNLIGEVGGLFEDGLDAVGDAAKYTYELGGKGYEYLVDFGDEFYRALGSIPKETAQAFMAIHDDAIKYAKMGVMKNPLMATYYVLGRDLLRGESLLTAAGAAIKTGIKTTRESLQYAQMVAPFVPGVGSGVAAALCAANALANGKPITEAMIAAAEGVVPGGAVGRTAFRAGIDAAKGKSVTAIALKAARAQVPGKALGRNIFDAAVGIGQGRSIQETIRNVTGKAVVSSPFAADANGFIREVTKTRDIQMSSLSIGGRRVYLDARKNGLPICEHDLTRNGLIRLAEYRKEQRDRQIQEAVKHGAVIKNGLIIGKD